MPGGPQPTALSGTRESVAFVKDITKLCHVGEVDDAEVAHILFRRMGRASYPSEKRADMPDAENPRVSLHYSKKGRLSRVESALAQSEIDQILAEIEDKLLAPTEEKVSRTVLFARVPTAGTWECDRFTLTAAPEEAPRPPWLMGHHPLVLETPFPATPDQFFNKRSHRMAHEIELLLSLFVPFLLSTPRYTSHNWAYVPIPGQDDGCVRAQWVQRAIASRGSRASLTNGRLWPPLGCGSCRTPNTLRAAGSGPAHVSTYPIP